MTDQWTFHLHVESTDGKLKLVDITEPIHKAYFASFGDDGRPNLDSVADAITSGGSASLVERVMRISAQNAGGDGGIRTGIDPEAERLLSRLGSREPPTPAPVGHGTDDIYPYGGSWDEGRDYRITCYCGIEFTGELDGTVEAALDEHVEQMEREQAGG